MRRLFIVPALAIAACGGQTDDEGNGRPARGSLPSTFEVDEYDQVIVTESYQHCDADTECVLVDISCKSCCGRDAIFRNLEDEYDSAFSRSCEYYSGGVCDCIAPAVRAQCVDQRCRAEPALSP